jgi:hypothetical protein
MREFIALETVKTPSCTAHAALPHQYCDINAATLMTGPMQLKAGDRAKLPLCRVWNGSNKISL